MCGLFGVSPSGLITEEHLFKARQALGTLSHRGPDQSGCINDDQVFMGHRRLSILDLTDAGNQPMCSNDVHITVNGEIYNFHALKQDLISLGYSFKSSSDSEVVLHGYHCWGVQNLLERMDGMYAGIIYDKRNNQIHGFRDRAGIKPLYYYLDNNVFLWASEIKAIKEYLPVNSIAINNEAMIDFLAYRYIPAPKSAYKNLYKTEQASFFTFDLNTRSMKLRKYWHLKVQSSSGRVSNDEVIDNIQQLLRTAVSAQLVSDVPIGVFLSGGIDSSIIALNASLVNSQISSFTIGFKNSQNDESDIADTIASSLNTHHYHKYFDNNQLGHLMSKMAQWFDEPFGDTSALPTENVCHFAKDYVTVVLTGDGGDEIFGGYKWYNRLYTPNGSIRARLLNFSRRNPLTRLGVVEETTKENFVNMYASLRKSSDRKSIETWKKKLDVALDYDPMWAYKKHCPIGLSPRKTAQVIDFHTYLADDVLVKVDTVSMLHSLECRPPFLDQKIIEYGFGLPDSFVYQGNSLKAGLKAAYANQLPEKVIMQPKQGFGIQTKGWRIKTLRSQQPLQEAILTNFISGIGR